jgi:hypothetical protein
MAKDKLWGIRIDKYWVMGKEGRDAVYTMKRKAQQDADDFNSMRKKGDDPYTVKEYNK